MIVAYELLSVVDFPCRDEKAYGLPIDGDLPLSLWPRSKTFTTFFCFLRVSLSFLMPSSILSLTLRASASRPSRVVLSAGVSFGGGAIMRDKGSLGSELKPMGV